MLEIPLERQSNIPLYLQIAEHLERMISSGALPEGSRLPSSRELAFSLSVSRTTVIEAYRHLEDECFLRQKGRSGAYVCWEMDRTEKNREIGKKAWDMASDSPSRDLMPFDSLARISRDLFLSKEEQILELSELEGVPELRKELVSHAVSRGIPARWEDVFVTSGGREGLSLSMAALKTAGIRKLWMEELTYPDAVNIARSKGFDLGVIPLDHGKLPGIIKGLGERDALYLVPSFQNPTGRTIPAEMRRMLLDSSMERGVWILEDDAYGELRYGDVTVPALKSMSGSERVIYLGSFSQALFPGLRIGYSLIPHCIREPWKENQLQGAGPVSSFIQFMVMQFIRDGRLEESLNTARFTISSRMAALIQSIRKFLPCIPFSVPEGGIYLWLETPGIDGDAVENMALKKGIAVVSGNQFSWMGRKIEAVRLSVSSVESCAMETVVRELKKALYSG